MKILIQAYNIHNGGGAVLLKQLLAALAEKKYEAFVYVDERFSQQVPPGVLTRVVKPSVFSRLQAELEIKRIASNYNQVFCFGNLPPVFDLGTKTDLYLQNVLLLNGSSLKSFSFFVRIRICLERLWLRVFIKNVARVLVQSNSVKMLVQKRLKTSVDVCLAPFFDRNDFGDQSNTAQKKYDFVYIASTDPHKNYLNLFRALEYLRSTGQTYKVAISTSRFFGEEAQLFKSLSIAGVIQTFENLSRTEVLKLYQSSEALIYPSFQESFGMPLLEASSLGLPILASELDYVRDVVNPVETFNPESYLSIARAILRFKKEKDSSVVMARNSKEFIDFLTQS